MARNAVLSTGAPHGAVATVGAPSSDNAPPHRVPGRAPGRTHIREPARRRARPPGRSCLRATMVTTGLRQSSGPARRLTTHPRRTRRACAGNTFSPMARADQHDPNLSPSRLRPGSTEPSLAHGLRPRRSLRSRPSYPCQTSHLGIARNICLPQPLLGRKQHLRRRLPVLRQSNKLSWTALVQNNMP